MCCVLSTEYRVENSVGEGIDTYREMDNSKTCWDKTDNTLKSDVVEEVEYVLIGAGLPRTGTFSTLLALERLLPGKCYHMARAINNMEDRLHWAKAEAGGLDDDQWTSFISSRTLSASVDYPMSLYWKDLARLYPNAKVILTVRDPVKWYQSVRSTIREIIRFRETLSFQPLRVIQKIMGTLATNVSSWSCFSATYLGPNYPRGLFGAIDSGQETAIKFFNDWSEQVRSEISDDRLLVFDVKEGWDPLCSFLQVPVPEEPFPRGNDTAEMMIRINAMKRNSFLAWSGVFLALGATIGYTGYTLYRTS